MFPGICPLAFQIGARFLLPMSPGLSHCASTVCWFMANTARKACLSCLRRSLWFPWWFSPWRSHLGCILGLESGLAHRPQVQWPRQCPADVGGPVLLECHAQHGVLLLAILVEYAIAFGLALLLNQQIVARKFWARRLPDATDAVAGRPELDGRQIHAGNTFGPIAQLFKYLGLEQPSFFASPLAAKLTIMVLDAWTFISLHDDHDPRRPAGHLEGSA